MNITYLSLCDFDSTKAFDNNIVTVIADEDHIHEGASSKYCAKASVQFTS